MEDGEHTNLGIPFINLIDDQIGRAAHHPFMGVGNRTFAPDIRKIAQPLGRRADIPGDSPGDRWISLGQKIVMVSRWESASAV